MFVLNKITYYTDKNKKLGKNIERSDNWFHALMPYNILSLSLKLATTVYAGNSESSPITIDDPNYVHESICDRQTAIIIQH